MSEPSPAEILRANERVKIVSVVSSNLGTALIAASFGRWFLDGFDAYVLTWIIGFALLIWSGWYILTMLKAE
jgi:hypothetical protein